MSTDSSRAAEDKAEERAREEQLPDKIAIYGHSRLIYWWPVWLVGFVLAVLTSMDNTTMVVVPAGTKTEHNVAVAGVEGARDVAVAPANKPLAESPRLKVASTSSYGVIWAFTLLFVVFTTNVIFRGLASWALILFVGMIVLVLALLGWWDTILSYVGGLDVRMNMGGYLIISIPLFVMWLVVTFVYDHQKYLVFDQSQVRMRTDIGDGESTHDVTGITLEKKRDDVFRHWLLGLGSGDIRVRVGGPNAQEFEVSNVLNINWKLETVQKLLKEKQVTVGGR